MRLVYMAAGALVGLMLVIFRDDLKKFEEYFVYLWVAITLASLPFFAKRAMAQAVKWENKYIFGYVFIGAVIFAIYYFFFR